MTRAQTLSCIYFLQPFTPSPVHKMSPRIWIVLGATSAAAAVGWGAFHAHGMADFLASKGMTDNAVQHAMQNFDVAIRYQAMHAIALVLVGLIGLHGKSAWLDVAAFLFALGTLLFSGCLETAAMLEIKLPWFLVPAGGMAFILGWICLAVGAWVAQKSPQPT
jgi:uncharacterized membrane protein YgdD (TMEM256/DUF423 family)